MNFIPPLLSLFRRKSIQASAPLRGSIERGIAQQTQCLAFKVLGNTHSYTWEYPDTAPALRIDDVATSELMNAKGAAGASSTWLIIPWIMQAQHTRIEVLATFAWAKYDNPLNFRLKNAGLLNGLGSTNGPWTRDTLAIKQPRMSLWQRGSNVFKFATVKMSVDPVASSLDTGRTTAIYFEARVNIPAFTYTGLSQNQIDVYLVQAAIRDVYVRTEVR